MAFENNNKKTIDLPFFELMSQSPVAVSGISAMTSPEDSADSRFIYILVGSAFYKYDVWADTFIQLATCPGLPAVGTKLRVTKNRGHHARIISATSTTVQIGGIGTGKFNGETLRIIQGPGTGQEKTLTYVGDTIHDFGVVTTAAAASIADSTKKWRINQWAGYTVAITFSTGVTGYKKILYNDATTLYVSDANLMPHDHWNNQSYLAVAPYALPISTAGTQSHFEILSASYTVTAWDTIPNYSSFATIKTGGIYAFIGSATAPTLYYYDIAADTWQQKSLPATILPSAAMTDFACERTGKVGAALVTAKLGALSATARTVTDAGAAMPVDRYVNYRLYIKSGLGIGQHRRIVGNTATVFQLNRDWTVTPDSTSDYEIWPDYDKFFTMIGSVSSMFAYSIENDYWMSGLNFDDGVAANITCALNGTAGGWIPFGVTTGARIALGIQAVNATPTAAGTNYSLGDVLTCSVGGTGAQVIVTGVGASGAVTSIALQHSGTATGFAVGTGRATTGGTGSGCTIEITTVGPTALITTATNHFIKSGDSVTFAGCNSAGWNAAYTVIGVNGITSFSVATSEAASMAATASQSTTVIVDPSKNWIVNEHVGRTVILQAAGLAGATQTRWIVSNTATSLTVATIVAGANGTSRYYIQDTKAFGVDDQRRQGVEAAYGRASGGSATTLVDSSKNWPVNCWAGYLFKVEAGTGYGSGRISITSNTATTLTYTTQSFTPDATTKYEIADSWGLATAGAASTLTEATTKNWTTNYWAGKRIRFMAGTLGGTESVITANTATALTITGTPDATTAYCILSIPVRSTGIDLVWAHNSTNNRARYIYSPRGGGANQIDRYDITTGKWDFGITIHPQSESYTAGSSYCYDGGDRVFLTRNVASGPTRLFAMDVRTQEVTGIGTTTLLNGAAHNGNFLEYIEDPLGDVGYLYTFLNTTTLLCRMMINF
jgi:hypothetical protein